MLAAGAALIAAEASCQTHYGGPFPPYDAGADTGTDAGTAQAPAEQAPPDQGEAPPAGKKP